MMLIAHAPREFYRSDFKSDAENKSKERAKHWQAFLNIREERKKARKAFFATAVEKYLHDKKRRIEQAAQGQASKPPMKSSRKRQREEKDIMCHSMPSKEENACEAPLPDVEATPQSSSSSLYGTSARRDTLVKLKFHCRGVAVSSAVAESHDDELPLPEDEFALGISTRLYFN